MGDSPTITPSRVSTRKLNAPRQRRNHGCPEGDAGVEQWVRQVNARWLVHSDLRGSATAYLDHLEVTDPERLLDSCRIVRELMRRLGPAEDPKPRFYAGVFSLATPQEAQQYLHAHLFTLSLIPVGAHLQHPSADVPEVCAHVKQLRHEIHQCVMAVQAMP